MKAPLPLVSLSFLFANAIVASAQSCDYTKDTNCINAQALGTQYFPFEPLFPSPEEIEPILNYAIDPLSASEISALDIEADEAQKVAFWLDYAVTKGSSDEAVSQIAMLFTNASGDTAGAESNGCAAVLGSDCVRNLKEVLKWGMLAKMDPYLEQDSSLYRAIDTLQSNPLTNLSCPVDLFDDKALVPVIGNDTEPKPLFVELNRNSFLTEGGLPYASANATYQTVTRLRSYEAQLAKVGVGITVRAPLYIGRFLSEETGEYFGGEPIDFDEIQMEIACIRAENVDAAAGGADSENDQASGGQDENENENEDEDEGNGASRAGMVLLPVVVGALGAYVGLY
ncbi:hypothetical protein BJX61DRAFT_508012 [Aspergillus egyptiacus]|nr:hypothetical protein BJX61DRAFT_508012 [Aspergillus egyptiacus]